MLDKTDALEKPPFVAERPAFGKQWGDRVWAWIFCGIGQEVISRELYISEFLWMKMFCTFCTLNLTKRHHDGEVLDIYREIRD